MADDFKSFFALSRGAFLRKDMKSFWLKDGKEAPSQFEKEKSQVVVLDIPLPGWMESKYWTFSGHRPAHGLPPSLGQTSHVINSSKKPH